jgi:hypothetical protein
LKIVVQIQVGNAALSFETDESGVGVAEGIKSIQKIIKTYGEALASVTSKDLGKAKPIISTVTSPALSLKELNIKPQLKDMIVDSIRDVSYWNLALTILYHSPAPLTYENLMSISKELGKPIAYDWLNTDFQRKKYRGRVRSEEIPGSRKKAYSITELGRKIAETFFEKLAPKEEPN